MNDYTKWTVATLRAELSRRGFARLSKKHEMIKVLQDDDERKELELKAKSEVNGDAAENAPGEAAQDVEFIEIPEGDQAEPATQEITMETKEEPEKTEITVVEGNDDSGTTEVARGEGIPESGTAEIAMGEGDAGLETTDVEEESKSEEKTEPETQEETKEIVNVGSEINEDDRSVPEEANKDSDAQAKNCDEAGADFQNIPPEEPEPKEICVKMDAEEIEEKAGSEVAPDSREVDSGASEDKMEEMTMQSTEVNDTVKAEVKVEDDTEKTKVNIEQAATNVSAVKQKVLECDVKEVAMETDEQQSGLVKTKDEPKPNAKAEERKKEGENENKEGEAAAEEMDHSAVQIDTVGEVDDEFAINMALLEEVEKESETAEAKSDNKQDDAEEEEEEEDDDNYEEGFVNLPRLHAWIIDGYFKGKKSCALYISDIKKYKLLSDVMVETAKKSVQFLYKLNQFGKGCAVLDFCHTELCVAARKSLANAFGDSVKVHYDKDAPAKWLIDLARSGACAEFKAGHHLMVQDYPEGTSFKKLMETFPNAIFMTRVHESTEADEKNWFQKSYGPRTVKYAPPPNYKTYILVEFCSSREVNKAAEDVKEGEVNGTKFKVQTLEEFEQAYKKQFEENMYRLARDRIYKDDDRLEMLDVLSGKRRELAELCAKARRRARPEDAEQRKTLSKVVNDLTEAIKIDTLQRLKINEPVPEGRSLMTKHTTALWQGRKLVSKQDGKMGDKPKNEKKVQQTAKAPGKVSADKGSSATKNQTQKKPEPKKGPVVKDVPKPSNKTAEVKPKTDSAAKQPSRSPAANRNQDKKPGNASSSPRQPNISRTPTSDDPNRGKKRPYPSSKPGIDMSICYHCGKGGHFARECPNNDGDLGRAGQEGVRGGNAHASPVTEKSICYNCGKEGHFARECPSKSMDGGRGGPKDVGAGGSFAMAPVLALEEQISMRQQQIVMQQEMLERYEQMFEDRKRAAMMAEYAAANAGVSEQYQSNRRDQPRGDRHSNDRSTDRRQTERRDHDRRQREDRRSGTDRRDDRRPRDDRHDRYDDTTEAYKSRSPSSHRQYDSSGGAGREAYSRETRERNEREARPSRREDDTRKKRDYASPNAYSPEPTPKRVKSSDRKDTGEAAASVATVLKGLTQVIHSKMDEIARKAMAPTPQKPYATQSTDLSRPKAALPRAALPARQSLMSQSDRYGERQTMGQDSQYTESRLQTNRGQYDSGYGYQ